MKKQRRNLGVILATIALALVAVTFVVSMPTDGRPVALAAPTPVTIPGAGGFANVGTFWSGAVLTATGGSDGQNIQNNELMDLHFVIDQEASAVNTATLKLQFSNDNANWVDGATFETDNIADANDMQQYNVFGRYARVHATLANSNPVTVTVIGVAK